MLDAVRSVSEVVQPGHMHQLLPEGLHLLELSLLLCLDALFAGQLDLLSCFVVEFVRFVVRGTPIELPLKSLSPRGGVFLFFFGLKVFFVLNVALSILHLLLLDKSFFEFPLVLLIHSHLLLQLRQPLFNGSLPEHLLLLVYHTPLFEVNLPNEFLPHRNWLLPRNASEVMFLKLLSNLLSLLPDSL